MPKGLYQLGVEELQVAWYAHSCSSVAPKSGAAAPRCGVICVESPAANINSNHINNHKGN